MKQWAVLFKLPILLMGLAAIPENADLMGALQFMKTMARTPALRRQLLAEAFFGLAVARLALCCVPFERLSALFLRRVTTPEPAEAVRAQLRRDVRWAVFEAGGYLPGRTVCFPRAIAAQWMLRRRGVTTQVYYGARTTQEEGLGGHVWVQDGDIGVVGYQSAASYRILACYSNCETGRRGAS